MLRGKNACFRHFCGKSAIASHAGKIGLRVDPVVITPLAEGMIAVGAFFENFVLALLYGHLTLFF